MLVRLETLLHRDAMKFVLVIALIYWHVDIQVTKVISKGTKVISKDNIWYAFLILIQVKRM